MATTAPAFPDGVSVTCTACQQQIIGLEDRRVHYRSDKHLVNLKRKLTGMGPLTDAEFQKRLTLLQAAQQEQQDQRQHGHSPADGSGGKPNPRRRRINRVKSVCHVCHKTFSSPQALQNHEQSRRHLDTLRLRGDDATSKGAAPPSVSDMSETVSGVEDCETEWTPLPLGVTPDTDGPTATDNNDDDDVVATTFDDTHADIDAELQARERNYREVGSDRRCPFDDHVCESTDAALTYMVRTFGFFKPFSERLIDAAGFLRYINQKVGIGYACLACDKGFASVTDARNHMVDIGHCCVTSDDEAFYDEFSEFYDWGSDARPTDGVDGEEGWEEVDAASADVMDMVAVESTALTVATESPGRCERPIGRLDLSDGKEDDGETEVFGIVVGDKLVGHRTYQRYYKQKNSRIVDSRYAVVANRNDKEARLLALRKANGVVGPLMAPAGRKAQKFQYRRQQRFELLVGRKNYYVRKSTFKQNMAVLNSGYRA